MKSRLKPIKALAGQCLISLCNAFPWAKPRLKTWGMRTSKEWFGQRVVDVQLPGGQSYKLASVSQNYLSFELFWKGTGYYEPITTLVLQELAKSSDTFLDIGANIGFYSLTLSASRPGIDIVAFEPNPRLFQCLSRNAAVNRFERIQCEPLALSDEDGTALLHLNRSDMSASLRADFDANLTSTTQVQTTKLDSYLNRRGRIGRCLVKVDVEGHEEAFFEGARQTLAFVKPDIITEVAVNHGANAMALLRDNGYGFYQITDAGLLEADTLAPVVREPFVFLNYLLSTKPKSEIDAVFRRIQDQVKRIDLRQTSKYADYHALQQMKARQRQGREQEEPAYSLHS